MLFLTTAVLLFFLCLCAGDPLFEGRGWPGSVHGAERSDGGWRHRAGRISIFPRVCGGVLPGLPRHPALRLPRAFKVKGNILFFCVKLAIFLSFLCFMQNSSSENLNKKLYPNSYMEELHLLDYVLNTYFFVGLNGCGCDLSRECGCDISRGCGIGPEGEDAA